MMNGHESGSKRGTKKPQYSYQRPEFLLTDYSEEELTSFLDTNSRTVVSPKTSLIADIGYAECTNAGKSNYNEDEAYISNGIIRGGGGDNDDDDNDNQEEEDIPYIYIGVFDGHGGHGAAIKASKELHKVVHQSLEDVYDKLTDALAKKEDVTVDELIRGTLESSFWAFDRLILAESKKYKISGGCTALVALVILNKLYVANAGDGKAIVCTPSRRIVSMSEAFIPNSDRQRIQHIAYQRPELLRHPVTKEKLYNRHVLEREVGSTDFGESILYKDFYMTGWSCRDVTEDDITLVPLISGDDKSNRLLGTIGVCRGFGDHELLAIGSKVKVKEFLTSEPEVRIYDLSTSTIEHDYLIMGTDGLWDVLSNDDVNDYIFEARKCRTSEKEMAEELIRFARGTKVPESYWEMKNGELASGDDITVCVVSLRKAFTLINKN